MKRILLPIAFLVCFAASAFAQSSPPIVVTEVDGSPTVYGVTKVVVSNGTLTVSGTTATIVTGGGGGSGCTPPGTANRVLYDNGAGGCTSSAAFTFSGAKTTLGVAGSSVGAIGFNNATSGQITLQPVTGALGTVTLSLPAATGTLLYGGGPLGTPSSGTLTNATGLPIASGVSGLGTGVATALAVNVGSAGAFVTFDGALGTPSSGTLTNATGLPPATGIVGWPANASGCLSNNGSGTLSWAACSGGGGSQTPWTSNIDADGFNLRFDDSTGIQSTESGNANLLLFTSAASAVNGFTLSNAATGGNVKLSATGSDTNISIELIPKGTDATLGGQLVAPGNRRYDRPGITFDGASTEYGLGMDGSSWFLVNAPNIGLGAGDGFSEGLIAFNGHTYLAWGSSTATPKDDPPGQDLFRGRRAAATHLYGKADAAAPVAQTFTVQGVVAGTSNTAGVNTTWKASAGTGTGAGGSLIWQVAPAGSSGSTQNSYVTAMTIPTTGGVLFPEVSTPGTPAGNSANLYVKDKAGASVLYWKSDDGTEYDLSLTGGGSGTVTSVSFTGGLISVATATTTPALTVAGTSGGIPYFSSASTWASSAALTANLPVIGGGAGAAPSVGTVSGNTTTFVTTTGAQTSGRCVEIDASGNHVASSGACGGSGSQTPWTSNIDADGFNLLMDDSTGILSSESSNPQILLFSSVASAVNELTITNAATGNRPNIAASGDDTNIGITVTPKGTGATVLASGNLNFGGVAAGNVMFKPNGTGGAFRRGDDSNLSGFIDAGTWAAGTAGAYKAIIDAGNTAAGIFLSSDGTFYFSSSTSANGGLNDLSLVRAGTNTLRVGRGTTAGVGFVNMGRLVTAKTSGYSVVVNDSNTFFTNTGAGGSVTYTLPTPVVGMTYEFYRDANQTVVIDVGTGVTIQVGASTTTSGGDVTLDAVGSSIRITAISTTQWVGSSVGTLTFN